MPVSVLKKLWQCLTYARLNRIGGLDLLEPAKCFCFYDYVYGSALSSTDFCSNVIFSIFVHEFGIERSLDFIVDQVRSRFVFGRLDRDRSYFLRIVARLKLKLLEEFFVISIDEVI